MIKFRARVLVFLMLLITSMSYGTVDNSTNRKDYDPNGSIVAFPYDFRVDDADDMVVYEDGTIVTGGYSVTGIGVETGGDVTFDVAPLDSVDVLTLIREVPLTQETAYPAYGPFPAASHEAALDKLTFIAQQQEEQLSRALITESTGLVPPSVPDPSAGLYMRWKADLTGLENVGAPSVTVPEISHPSVADMQASTTLIVGDIVQTVAYYSTQDGGSALYEIVAAGTGTANGGSYIDLAGSGFQAKLIFVDGVVNVKQFGAYGDYPTHDDTATIAAAAVWACSVTDSLRSILYFPGGTGADGSYQTTETISLTRQCDVIGGSKGVAIVCTGSADGIEYTSSVTDTKVSNIAIIHPIRHTTTPNTAFAIKFNGDVSNIPNRNVVDNVFIDGFGIPIAVEWSIDVNINNVISVFGGGFVRATGICLSNRVTNSTAAGNGIAFNLGDGVETQQGWFINNNVIDSLSTGTPFYGYGATYGKLTNNIFDFVGGGTAVLLQSAAALGSFGWDIKNNYIAFGANGDQGIRLLSSFNGATLNTGNTIDSNVIFPYPTYTLTYGILIDGALEENNIISKNHIKADTYDVLNSTGINNAFIGNHFLGSGGYNGSTMAEYSGNTGSISSSQSLLRQDKGDFTHYYSASMPTSGSYRINDFVQNIDKGVDGNNMILDGWHRITTGSAHVINVDWNAMYVSVVSPAN